MIRLLTAIGTFLIAPVLWAQDLLIRDSTAIERRHFQPDLAERYTDPAFDYESTIEGEAKNFIVRWIEYLLNFLGELLGFEPDPSTYLIVEYLIYGLVIVASLYFVIRLLMGHSTAQIFGKKAQELTPMSFEETQIDQLDLEKAIQEALAVSDYRQALRYHYLLLLQRLSGKGLINWHFQKTNLDYIQEIEPTDIQQDFRSVSIVFERIWYGAYPFGKIDYEQSAAQFDELKKRIAHAG